MQNVNRTDKGKILDRRRCRQTEDIERQKKQNKQKIQDKDDTVGEIAILKNRTVKAS